jgi:hypothetical protein
VFEMRMPGTRRFRMAGGMLLCLILPLLMGGCPEFQSQAVDAFETATRSVIDAAVDLFFDQFRPSSVR